ncbi:MAG: hypothetical protein ACI4TP_02155, partial [Anaerotignum sp.]
MTVSFRISTTAIRSHDLSDHRLNGFLFLFRRLLSDLGTSCIRFFQNFPDRFSALLYSVFYGFLHFLLSLQPS